MKPKRLIHICYTASSTYSCLYSYVFLVNCLTKQYCSQTIIADYMFIRDSRIVEANSTI